MQFWSSFIHNLSPFIEKQWKTRGWFGSEPVDDRKDLESRPKEIMKITNLVRRKKNYIYKKDEVSAATIIANRWKDRKDRNKQTKNNKLLIVT